MHVLRVSVLCGLIALCGLLAAGAAQARADASDVLVVGDSLAVGTEPFLPEALADRNVVFDAKSGITTPQGMRLLRMALRTLIPKTAVFQLGSNDGGDPQRFANRVRRTLALLPLDTCVVWSTIIRPRRKGEYRGLNRVLHKLKKTEPRLVVVDWEHAVTGGAVFLPDGLHADSEGYRYRSAMIADAVHSGCAAQGLTPPA